MKTLDLKRKADSSNGSNGTSSAVQTPQAKNGAMPNSKAFDEKTNSAEATKLQTEAPQVEPKKEEAKPIIAVKPVLNLEGTLKLVEELHRRKIHRDNLLSTINTLDEFKVMVQDENEDIDSPQFQGCKLTIEDDDRNSFTTKNPAIIKAVAEYVNKLCVDKLAEIEANIVIPA